MRSALLTFVSLVLLASLFGCGDEDQGPTVAFTGVTLRDEMGVAISEDPDDWRMSCSSLKDVIGDSPAAAMGFPNPAAITTAIEFTLPRAGIAVIQIWAHPEHVGSSEVLVCPLLAGSLDAGTHSVRWDLRDSGGTRVPPGIYRCRYQLLECTGFGDIEVQDVPEVSAAAKLFASEHWSVERLQDACSGDLNSLAGFYYTVFTLDELPQWTALQGDERALYFAIGHCDQFVFGWDDYVDPRDLQALGPDYSYQDLSQAVVSLRREAYRGLK